MTLLLYLAVAAATLFAWNRWMTPLSRGTRIVLILMPFVFVGPALVMNRIYGGHDMLFLSQPWSDYAADYGLKLPHNWYLLDQVLALAPWQHQVREAFAQHQWPLWNPGMNSGDILAASMQVAPYNPLNLIALLLPLDLSTTFCAAMVFFLAGLFTFAYAREIDCSEGASLIAATGFAFSSGVVFWVGWTHLGSWTLLPFVMLAVRRVIRTRDLASFSQLTIAFVLLILFGHPETMLHVVVIGAAYGIFELVSWATDPHPAFGHPLPQAGEGPSCPSPARGRRACPERAKRVEGCREAADEGPSHMKPVFHSVVIAVGAGVVALLITAIFLLPFVDVLDDTWQYELFKEQARNPAPVNAAEVWKAMGATFIPYFGGASWYNLTTHYDIGMARVGSVILALALIGACQMRRRREVWFLIALAIIALIAAWSAPPVTTLLRKVPLFAVAKNERLGFAAAFALSMLAAVAFDARKCRCRLQPAHDRLKPVATHRRLVLAVGAALAIATGLLWRTRLEYGVQPKMMLIGAAAELLGIALVIVALSARERIAIALVVGAIATQRLAEDGFIYPALQRRMFYPSVPLLEAIPRDPLYRVVGTKNLFIPNAASMYGLEDVRGYASMTYAPYKKSTQLWCPTSQRSYLEVTDLTLPFLSFLGVKHAITPVTMEPPPGWRVVADDRNTRLMENQRAIPRVFIPKIVRFMNSHDTEMEEMLQATDFAEKAWISSTEVMPQDMPNGEADLKVQRIGSRYEIDVGARSPVRLVITEVGWPGWRAYLDGRRIKTSTANLAFLSVYVPEGTHHVRLVYLPEAFTRGRAISFATILVLSAAIVVRRLRRKS